MSTKIVELGQAGAFTVLVDDWVVLRRGVVVETGFSAEAARVMANAIDAELTSGRRVTSGGETWCEIVGERPTWLAFRFDDSRRSVRLTVLESERLAELLRLGAAAVEASLAMAAAAEAREEAGVA